MKLWIDNTVCSTTKNKLKIYSTKKRYTYFMDTTRRHTVKGSNRGMRKNKKRANDDARMTNGCQSDANLNEVEIHLSIVNYAGKFSYTPQPLFPIIFS